MASCSNRVVVCPSCPPEEIKLLREHAAPDQVRLTEHAGHQQRAAPTMYSELLPLLTLTRMLKNASNALHLGCQRRIWNASARTLLCLEAEVLGRMRLLSKHPVFLEPVQANGICFLNMF